MNTLELKNIVISQISQIEDKSFLSALKTILDSKSKEKITLSKHQIEEINDSKKEIANNQFQDNDSLDKEIKQWLTEKNYMVV
ncbi:hypothetical protein R1T16_09450 [Flavobacterium sp. DG1-102-2]|uniref:hypothetical protein n=1 Tax=Flavobacterium sp. DG1-102-2 TaxID=3081663 RepID=UPI002949811F|nr:hypothetical protein [Flavobacterium sp. DG1-102-2]MDV6168648.1 hypothetical protein [Flavobacterium sp. DG1-102-2]